jgi:nitroreductase
MITVTEALERRISIRQFLPDPLDECLVRDILEVARWAPSGGNLQPWRVVAVAGEEREAVIRLAAQSGAPRAAVDDFTVLRGFGSRGSK